MSTGKVATGRVTSIQSNYYYVDYNHETWTCFLKGNLKKEIKQNTDRAVLVGDWVSLDTVDKNNQTAWISEAIDRKNSLLRPKVANVDKAVIVYPAKEPEFDPVQVDRYLTVIQLAGLTPLICISKSDLMTPDPNRDALINFYQTVLGVPVLLTSIHNKSSLTPLLEQLNHSISVLAGPSGAGKSSLINTVRPELNLEVREVSEKIGRGQHTTRHVSLIQLTEHSMIVDTPGFSQLNFEGVLPQDIQQLYPEFSQLKTACDYSDCLHRAEELGCAVQNNLDEILPSRWISYQDILAETLKNKDALKETSQKDEYGHKTLSQKGMKDLKILKLKNKDRSESRNTRRQNLTHNLDDYLNDED